MGKIWNNIRMFLWLTCLTGVVYPLLVTLIAQLTMKQQADGDFIVSNGEVVGAVLIAQHFESDKYFWPRPSAIGYNPLPSGGSNLGPTSIALKQVVEERQEKIFKAHATTKKEIPPELLFASGSGLDPHITLYAACFQVERVARARNMPIETVREQVDRLAIKKGFGFLGVVCVNVLLLNEALDRISAQPLQAPLISSHIRGS